MSGFKVHFNKDDALILVDRTNSKYRNIQNDTTSTAGWNICYLISRNPQRKEDLFISYQKDNIKQIYSLKKVLQYDTYRFSIPEYEGENDLFIFLRHFCGSGCGAITVLPKDSLRKPLVFSRLVAYDICTNKIIQWDRKPKGDLILYLKLTDIYLNKEYFLEFDNNCHSFANPILCISKIEFNENRVDVWADLTDKNDTLQEKLVIEHKWIDII
jgi:hypothetical protein